MFPKRIKLKKRNFIVLSHKEKKMSKKEKKMYRKALRKMAEMYREGMKVLKTAKTYGLL